MLGRLLSSYDAAYARRPMITAFATCAVKSGASDVVAQRQLEGANTIDVSRTGKFLTWGGAYCGCFQHLLYNVAYPRVFGSAGKLKLLPTMCFELGVHFPFVANPCYYACNSLFTGRTATDGLIRYRDEFWNVMRVVWCIWTPAHYMTFAVVPPRFRIAWVASVSFGWLVVLSYLNPMSSSALKSGDP